MLQFNTISRLNGLLSLASLAMLLVLTYWLALPELGHLALIMAFVSSIMGAVMPLCPFGDSRIAIARTLQLATTALAVLSFFCLIYGFATSDFSLALVSQYSHSSKPMIYKISGTWGNHEGSLLLWVLILVIYGGFFARASRRLPPLFSLYALSVQSMITAAFIGFSLFTSNPFERLDMPPLDGRGLNPVLQDIGLALHPPILYLGYVGLSMVFSLAVAGLMEGRTDKLWGGQWGRLMRPWVLSAWSALTIGIALGSWWAYYELGWGGWWFWDPVENASLMPWLVATALLHSVLVLERRGQLQSWVILLAIMAFSLSLVGTFIVRSGLLTSVHSFASDPSRGIFILILLIFSIGIPLILFAWRAPLLRQHNDSALLSRETVLVVNNIVLVVATLVVIIGTFYPLVLEVWNGKQITVGPPYFDAAFNPVMAVALVGMVIGLGLAWRRGVLPHGRRLIILAIGAAVAVMGLAIVLDFSVAGAAGLALLGWLAAGTLGDIQAKLKLHQPRGIVTRLRTLGLPIWGVWLGHLGVAVFLVGALGDGLGRTEVTKRLKIGEVAILGERQYRLLAVQENTGANYTATAATLQLEDLNAKPLAILKPEKRFYPIEGQVTTEAAIRPRLSGDDYAALGDGDGAKGYSVRLYRKPFVSWIWGGALIMASGGILAFLGLRRRSKMEAKSHDA